MVATLLVVGNEFSAPNGPSELGLGSGDSHQVTLTPADPGDADPSRLVFPIMDDNILAKRCWLDSKGLFLGVPESEPAQG